MQSEEPSSCLVNALVDEVCRISKCLVYSLLVLKWIMYLSIRHRAGVKPHINKVSLSVQRFARLAYKHDIVYIRTMHVYLFIVLL